MRYAIYGIGGFGREVAPLVENLIREKAAALHPAKIHGDLVFVDDAPSRPEWCNGLPVIDFDQLNLVEHRDRRVIVCVGDGRLRQRIEARCEAARLAIGSVMAPTSRILADNQIEPGAVICDHVTITSNAKIGKSFQANIYSYVAHDCVIGDYVTFAPRVSCNGNIHIGDYAYIGTGAVFNQGKEGKPLTVGEGAIVGMGAVVTKSVEPYTIVAGNPARFLKAAPRPKV